MNIMDAESNNDISIEINNVLTNWKNNEDTIINEDYDIPEYKTQKFKFKNKKILVLSGGGVKGFAHLGALHALNQKKYLDNIEIFAGTSVGALICFFLIIGYTPLELYEIMKNIDLEKLKTVRFDNLFFSYGLNNGQKIEYLFERLIAIKHIDPLITFEQLYEKTKKKLIMTTVCVNDRNIIYLSHETFPKMPIKTALRMTSSIPLFFSPVVYENKYYIDGACIDNYPIHLFSNRLNEVIGIFLKDANHESIKISNFEEYIINTIKSLMEGGMFNTIKAYEKYSYIISIENAGYDFNFKLDQNKRTELFELGHTTLNKAFPDHI